MSTHQILVFDRPGHLARVDTVTLDERGHVIGVERGESCGCDAETYCRDHAADAEYEARSARGDVEPLSDAEARADECWKEGR